MTFRPGRAFDGRRVLVTGGAGFVDARLVHRLVDQSAQVTVLDNLFTGDAEVIPPGAQFVCGSVNDEGLVRDGMQTRDFTYIADAVDATLIAGIHPRAEGEVFNIGTGIETSVNGLAEAIGRPIRIDHIDQRDIEKIRRMLHWSPQITLDRGLTETARWLTDGTNLRGHRP